MTEFGRESGNGRDPGTLMPDPANPPVVREFGFELALCAHLEGDDRLVGRQLGTGVHGRRVMDVVLVEPGPAFAERAAITPSQIPAAAIESDVGPGRACYWKDAFDCHPKTARDAVDRSIEIGFFERERRNGRTYVRQVARYPDQWFGRLVGIENKPDLGRPGALETQLLTDVTVGVLDAVVLATESHITAAHRNRVPEAVGLWQFDPDRGTLDVVREPSPLSPDEPGVEIIDRGAARTDIRVVTAGEAATHRRRLAERVYGKGWRSFAYPACDRASPDADGIPHCPWAGRAVQAARDCGPDCAGHQSASPPAVDTDALRAAASPWDPEPPGRHRRQSDLAQF